VYVRKLGDTFWTSAGLIGHSQTPRAERDARAAEQGETYIRAMRWI